MYFVVEWTTMSMPSSSGRWKTGVANVLSTTVTIPRSRASATTAARSVSLSSGFVGVSSQTRRVSGRIAAATFATSLVSTKVNSRPYCR